MLRKEVALVKAILVEAVAGWGRPMQTGDGADQPEAPGESGKRSARVLEEPGAARTAQAHNRT